MLLTSNILLSQNRVDSLKNILEQNNVSNSPEIYLNLFIEYRLSNIDTALLYAQKASEAALESGDSLLYVRGEYAVAWVLSQKGIFKEAISHYLGALKTARSNNFEDREKAILNSLALAYYYNAQYDKSLDYHFRSLALREKEGNLKEIVISCNNIGLVYYQIADFEKALQYFKKSIEIEESLNLEGIEGTFINIGLCLAAMGKHGEAIDNYERALDLCEKGCGSKIMVEAYTGAGFSYAEQGNGDLAEKYFERALASAASGALEANAVVTYYNWAMLKLERQEIEDALQLLQKGHELATSISYRKGEIQNLQLFAEIYSHLEDYQQAYLYQRRYDSLNKTILNEVIAKNLLNIQLNFEERQNLATISLQKTELTRRTTLLILSVIIIFLAIIIVFMLFKNNRHRKNVNRKLSDANDTIEKQNLELTNMNHILEERVRERTQELKASNAALLKSNTDLDNFIYKTSHDIRGPLATLQGMCNVALMDIEEPMAVGYFNKLATTAQRLNEILSKLLVINQINNSLISEESVNIESLLREVIDQQRELYGDTILVKEEIESNLNFRSDVDLVKLIVSNLITNAFKFHNTSDRVASMVQISVARCDDNICLQVIDNGIGIDEKASSKIFEIFSKASDMSDTAGLGLYLAKLAVEKLGGDIELSKTKEEYTCFSVKIPGLQ